MPDRVKALEINYKYSNDLCFGISVIIWPNWTMSWFEITFILFDFDELCFVVYLWIFTEGEGDGIKSRLPFEIFSILTCQAVVGSWSGSHQIVLTQLSGSQLAWSACLYYVRCGNIWRICQYLKDFVNIWRICHTCTVWPQPIWKKVRTLWQIPPQHHCTYLGGPESASIEIPPFRPHFIKFQKKFFSD